MVLGKKLNDKGFGTKDMIIYSCVIIFFLLLAYLLILSFYKNKDRVDANDLKENQVVDTKTGAFYIYYTQQENNLKVAALKYARDNKLDASTSVRLELSLLKENGYIDDIRDSEDNTICLAHVYIKNSADDYDVEPYLKCNSYTTDNYR